MYQGTSPFPTFPLLPKVTFTPSIQPHLCLPHTGPPLTSAINTVLAIWYASFFPCPNHLNSLWSALLANSLSIPAFLHISSFLTLSIRNTPTKLLKHFISRIIIIIYEGIGINLRHRKGCGTQMNMSCIECGERWKVCQLLYCQLTFIANLPLLPTPKQNHFLMCYNSHPNYSGPAINFISRTFTFLLSAFLISLSSGQCPW